MLNDLRLAVRSLLRQPALSASVVLTLALGVGLNGTVFSIVNAYLFRPLPAVNPDEIVLLGSTSPELSMPHEMSWPDYRDQAALPVYRDAIGWTNWTASMGAAGSRAERVFVGVVSANYFDFLGVRPVLGRAFLPGEDTQPDAHRVMLITHDFWQRHFGGDSSIIGRDVPINGRAASIIGVLPPSFRPIQPLLDMPVWMPLNQVGYDFTRQYEDRGDSWLNVAMRLAPGVSVSQARAASKALAERIATEHPGIRRGFGVEVIPEKRSRPVLFVAAHTGLVSGVFLALTMLVLLVACANVAGLLLSRAAARERELAVRAALGASRPRIARLLLAEALLLGGAGGILALAVAAWSATLLSSIRIATDAPVRFDIEPDWRVFAFTLLTALLASLAAGMMPALRGSLSDPHQSLKSGTRSATAARQRLRSGLVIAQVAVAVVVLVCGGMFVRSVQAAAGIDLGFRTRGVLLGTVTPADQGYDRARALAFADRLVERAKQIPGVADAVLARRIPIGYSNSADRIEPEGGMANGGNVLAFTNVVSPGYLAAMGIPVLEGRDFTARDDSAAPGVAIVSAALAGEMWPGRSAIGQRFRFPGDSAWTSVVGVARNTVWMSPGEPGRPFIYYPVGQRGASDFTLHLVTALDDPASLVAPLRAAVAELDGDIPLYDVRTLHQHLHGGRAFFFLRLGAVVAATFGLIALALGAVGLFGLIAFGVEQRTREIGIRLALGASGPGIQRLMIRNGLLLVAGGLAIGLPAALIAANGLTGLLVGISPRDPLALAGGIAVLITVTIVAAWLPSRRAARVDPMIALRSD